MKLEPPLGMPEFSWIQLFFKIIIIDYLSIIAKRRGHNFFLRGSTVLWVHGGVRVGAEGLWHWGIYIKKSSSTQLTPLILSFLYYQMKAILSSFFEFLWGLELIQETWFLPCMSDTQKHSKTIIVTTGPILHAFFFT